MKQDWQMPRRHEGCGACGRTFAVGDPIRAQLLQAEAGYERCDYCLTCEPPQSGQVVATWRTRRPEPAARPRTSFDRDSVLELFEAVRDASEPAALELRFVLALLLWRRKLLRLDATVRAEDREVWRFARVKSDEVYEVARPALDEARVETLSAQLDRLLAGEPIEINLPEKDTDAQSIPEETPA